MLPFPLEVMCMWCAEGSRIFFSSFFNIYTKNFIPMVLCRSKMHRDDKWFPISNRTFVLPWNGIHQSFLLLRSLLFLFLGKNLRIKSNYVMTTIFTCRIRILLVLNCVMNVLRIKPVMFRFENRQICLTTFRELLVRYEQICIRKYTSYGVGWNHITDFTLGKKDL